MPASPTRKRTERKAELLRLLHRNEQTSLPELARVMGVSDSTLRRDVRELVDSGSVRRRFGRVELIAPSGEEMPFALRQTVHEDEKRRIARKALELLRHGDTVVLSGGTTTLQLARLLPGQRRLTVITNALRVANALADRPGIDLVVLGGAVRPDEQTMHGHLAELGAREFRADKFVYGIEAISPRHGLTHSQLVEVGTDRALAEAAAQVIVLADHSKFGRVAPALVLPLSRVYAIVTGHEVAPDVVRGLRAQGVQVLLA